MKARSRAGSLYMALLFSPVAMAGDAAAPEAPDTAVIVAGKPACAYASRGKVSISVGSRDTDAGRGAIAKSVGYAQAFARLAAAGKDAGGNGVILRRHEAAYVSRGARRGERPAYIALVGTAIAMEMDSPSCRFDLVDPVEFARRSQAADKEQVTTDNRAF